VDAPRFEQVYRDHASYVVHSLRRLGVAERHLEDVAHDVFIAVHRKLSEFDPEKPLKPWLFGFCFRMSLDHRRLAAHRRELLEDAPADDASPGASPEDAAASSEARARVLDALARLPDEQRAVLVLHDIDGVAMPHIAQALETPLNTAYSRLRLARRAFEAALRTMLSPGTLAAYGQKETP
jgi:RNA polymerase sigma-70 factor (ECF subfamily)